MPKEKPPEWVSEELERQKIKERLEQIKQKALEAPNTPYIFVEGKGYFEVPAKVASQLTEPGITLGMPLGLGFAEEAFRYLEEQKIITREERLLVTWSGTAEEALERIEKQKT